MGRGARILMLHHGFPGQFEHLLPRLQARGHTLRALVPEALITSRQQQWPSIQWHGYKLQRSNTSGIHDWALDFESKLLRAEAVAAQADFLKRQGYMPDLILGHPGWGELLCLAEIWPNTPQLHYVEFCYGKAGSDLDFHDRWLPAADWRSRARAGVKNANVLLSLEQMASGVTPTPFQHSLLPAWAQARTAVIHDGIPTTWLHPDASVRARLSRGVTLQAGDPVITFVNRTFEPYRGVHVFLRALAIAQQRHPQLQAILVGQDSPRVSYGADRSDGVGWLTALRRELGDALDWSRIHCLGQIPHQHLRKLYQLSAAHVYLTYPFVLSWSLLEALSSGCLVLSNNVAPVLDYVEHGRNGLLVEFAAVEDLAAQLLRAVQGGPAIEQLRQQARQSVIAAGLDLEPCCSARIQWLEAALTAA